MGKLDPNVVPREIALTRADLLRLAAIMRYLAGKFDLATAHLGPEMIHFEVVDMRIIYAGGVCRFETDLPKIMHVGQNLRFHNAAERDVKLSFTGQGASRLSPQSLDLAKDEIGEINAVSDNSGVQSAQVSASFQWPRDDGTLAPPTGGGPGMEIQDP